MAVGRTLSRRSFLRLAGGASAVAAGAGLTSRFGRILERAAAQPSGSCPPATLDQVEHVVMFMHENRSFDHYFGTFHGVEGFGNPEDPVFHQVAPVTPNTPTGIVIPYRINNSQHSQIFDVTHDWAPQHDCWHGGRMSRWVTTHMNDDGDNGVITMGYYTRADLPFHYALADAFTICDRYHCSMIGPTDPNHLYWLSATIDPDGLGGGPVIETFGDCGGTNAADFRLTWKTMPEALEEHGVSWKFYGTPDFHPYGFTKYFAAYDPPSPFYDKGVKPTFADFISDARTLPEDKFPQVSWLLGSFGNSEHPPNPSNSGEQELATVIDALTSNPELWAKTVLFFTFDENGGYFDHVGPLTPPAGTPGEYLTKNPVPSFGACNQQTPADFDQPIGLGFRVPMLVISPFSRADSQGGFVCSDRFDHTSMLRFIETRWGVPVPNLTDWRRSVTGDMTSAFNWAAAPDTSIPQLPNTPNPNPCPDGCQDVQPPINQKPAQQEPGSPRRPSGCIGPAAAAAPAPAPAKPTVTATVAPASPAAQAVTSKPNFTG